MTNRKNRKNNYIKGRRQICDNQNKPRRKPMISKLEETNVNDNDLELYRDINIRDNQNEIEELESAYKDLPSIPKRPLNVRSMNKETLEKEEFKSFSAWMKNLGRRQRESAVLLPPFERNIEFWRQLWRVIERSDICCQILDARNPLLFRNKDLEKYVKEVDHNKINILLINKADMLTESQREAWARYFDRENLRVIFWSAGKEYEKIRAAQMTMMQRAEEAKLARKLAEDGDYEDKTDNNEDEEDDEDDETNDEDDESDDDTITEINELDEDLYEKGPLNYCVTNTGSKISNSAKLVRVNQLVEWLDQIPLATGRTSKTVGFIGYPNVGKSSTMNALFGRKKVAVSAKPGRTKRFQTLVVTERLTICDSPGMVMPSFHTTKADMSIGGILPIHVMREFLSPIALIVDRIPLSIFEGMYGIELNHVRSICNSDKKERARALLESYSRTHGLMNAYGNPNIDSAAKIILKDFVNGRLLYRHPPPNISPEEYQSVGQLPDHKQIKYNKRLEKRNHTHCPESGSIVECQPTMPPLFEPFIDTSSTNPPQQKAIPTNRLIPSEPQTNDRGKLHKEISKKSDNDFDDYDDNDKYGRNKNKKQKELLRQEHENLGKHDKKCHTVFKKKGRR